MSKQSENTAISQTRFRGLNSLLRLQNYITGYKTSLEKIGEFWYNANQKIIVLSSLLALRRHLKCDNARSLRPVKELPLHSVKTLCLVLVSLLQNVRKMRWHLHNLPTICLSSKKLPTRKQRYNPLAISAGGCHD